MAQIVPAERIEKLIFLIRGRKVMLSTNLAELYEVEPKTLVQAVKRNLDRFPEDFMFQLTWEEFSALKSQNVIIDNSQEPLRSQNVTLKKGRGQHPKYPPYAFTEQGVTMLSSVLRSKRAVNVNIAIMRTFVKLREMMASHKDLARKLEQLEKKYDTQFKVVFDAIRELMAPPQSRQKKIGFRKEEL